MTLTVRSASVIGATTAYRALTHAEMDANWAHVISSANQSFVQSGTGAVSEAVQTFLRRLYYDVKSFGAAGNGSTDDTSAIQAAIDACQAAGGGVVYFPPGTYVLNTGLTLASYTNVWLVGAGWNVTSLAAGADSITLISMTGTTKRCAVQSMWVGSFSARTGVTGLSFVGTALGTPVSELLVRDVKIQNVNNPIVCTNMQQSNMENVGVVQSIASAVSGVGMNVKGSITCNFRDFIFLATVGTFGNDNVRVDQDCDTPTLQNFNISGGTTGYGIRFRNGAGSTGPRLARATNCYAEDCSRSGFYVEACRDLRLQGCHAAVNTVDGFTIAGGTSIELTDCFALQNGAYGYYISGGTGVGLVGCNASDNSQTTTNTTDGIRIENNVTGIRVIGCKSGDFVFGSGNRQRYGLSIGATSTDYIYAKGNDLQSNNTADMGNFSTGTNNDLDYENTFTGTLTGFTATITGTVRYQRRGRIATLYIPLLTGTSNTTACTMTGMPTDVRPARAQDMLVAITDNGTNAVGWASIATSGVITLAPTVANNAAGWTNSGTKALRLQTITYPLD